MDWLDIIRYEARVDIAKTAKPSKWQLEKEGANLPTLDENGKDINHSQYGTKNPKHSEYMKKAMIGKNKGKKRPDLARRNKLGHSEATKKKISANHADVSGKNNPNYKHGRRSAN